MNDIKFYILLSLTTIQVSAQRYMRHNTHDLSSYSLSDDNNQPTCDKNEEYLKCSNEYGRHCRDILHPSEYKRTEPELDCGDGCFCIQGLYRNDGIDLCVTKEQCIVQQPTSLLDFMSYEDTGEQRFRSINYRRKHKRYPKSANDKRKQKLEYLKADKRRQYLLKQVRHYYISGKKKRTKVRPSNDAQRRRNQKLYEQKKYAKRMRAQNSQSRDGRCGRANEMYRRCGTDCGNTCNKIRESRYCHPNVVCRSGCFCITGYVRDDFGACVAKQKCVTDYSKCGKNKKYQKCGNYCNMLCADVLNPGHRVCDHKKCFAGCFCINGTFLNGKKQCVHPKVCAQSNHYSGY